MLRRDQSLLGVLRTFQTTASEAGLRGDPHEDAVRLVAAMGLDEPYGPVVELALRMRRRPTVHVVAPQVADLVAETDLDDLPEEPPRLLRGPWVLSAARGWSLWDAVLTAAGYPDERGYLWLILWRGEAPDRISETMLSTRIRAAWGSRLGPEQLEEQVWRDLREQGLPEREVAGLFLQAVRFAVILGLLLEADLAPVWVDDPERRRRSGSGAARRKEGRPRRGEWITRTVYLAAPRRREAAAEASEAAPGRRGGDSAAPAEGREPVVVPVRGFLRRQAYGPKLSLRKWVYVRGYQARRWIVPDRPRRIYVRPEP